MENSKKRKVFLPIITLFIMALFGYSAYSAFYVFDDLGTSEVVLYSVLMSLCNAAVILLYTIFDAKHQHSTKSKIIGTAVTALVSAGVCFGTVYSMAAASLNTSIGSVTVAIECIFFCILMVIYLGSLSKKKKNLLPIITAVVILLFVYSVYSAFYVFDDLKTIEIVLYSTIISLCNAAIILLYTIRDTKHKHSTANRIISTAVTALVTAGVCFGTVYGLKTIYLDGSFGPFTVAFSSILFGISLAIYFNSLSRTSHKALYKVVAAVLAVVLLGEGSFMAVKTMMAYSLLEPLYSLKVSEESIGGVKTEDSEIVYDFALSTEKPLRNTKLGTDTEIAISLAKNEWEGFQIFFATAVSGKKVSLDITEFKNAEGKTLKTTAYKEYYSKVYGFGNIYCCEYADALVPVSFKKEPYGGSASLKKGLIQGFYIRAFADSNAAAGEYTATLTAKNENDKVILQKEITATVKSFTLPQTPYSASAFGNTSWGNSLYTCNNVDPDDEAAKTALDLQYYELLLENRISPYFLPYDILDERADAYMSDPRLTSFEIPYPADDELLVKYYTKVTSNPEWAKKGYFYPIDEPNTTEAYERYLEITERLSRLCPGYNMVTPFSADAEVEFNGQKSTPVEIQTGRSSILCPLNSTFDEAEQINQLKESQKAGSTFWSYVCCVPQGDYCNLFIRHDAIKHRLLLWQQKAQGITGMLYWSVPYYEKVNPWECSKTWDKYEAAGDGCLVYPGGYIGLDEPVITLRLVNLTDGFEDYDYLTLAEERLGTAWINEKISKVSTSLTEYTSDYALLEQIRNEVGEAISK